MIITTGATLIFCEGLPTSLDRLMLTVLPFRTPPHVVPAGGKHGILSFVEGALHGRTDSPSYLIFRDRDLDVEPPQEPQLVRLPSNKPYYAGHRSCIESYFLSGTIMVDYWDQQLTRRGRCPLSTDEFDAIIADAARSLAGYQSVRWGLRKLKSTHPANDLVDKLGEKSGELPRDLSFTSCLTDASSILGGYRAQAGARTPELFRKYAEEYRVRFAEPQFYASRAFLAWFHGKDLKTAFNTELVARRPDVNFPTDHYMQWAASQMSHWYQQYPDLVQLVDLAN